MEKLSKNRKKNGLLRDIERQILDMSDTREESIDQVRYCKKNYPKEPDYNIVQSGFLLCYTKEIEELYKKNGYETKGKNADRLWKDYIRHTGEVIRRSTNFKNL